MTRLRSLLYPVFGVMVVLAYAHVVKNGIEPFGASTKARTIPAGPDPAGGHGTRAGRHSMIWLGGFGGK